MQTMDDETAENSPGISINSSAMISTKLKLHKFMELHGETFATWWASQSTAERVMFVRDVYPPIYESPTDGWCLVGGRRGCEGTKTYEGRYDQYVLVVPEFTAQYLVAGANLPNLIMGWTESADALVSELSERVVSFRQLYKTNRYKWLRMSDKNRAIREQNVQRGDHALVLIKTNRSEGEEGLFVNDDLYGKLWVKIDNPEFFTRGTGTTESSDGGMVNIYSMGGFLHPFEFETLNEAMGAMLHCLSSLVDEYKEDYLGSQCRTSISKFMMSCGNCGLGAEEAGSLTKCSQCLAVWYCNKDCQIAHFPRHKAFCNRFKKKAVDTAVETAADASGN